MDWDEANSAIKDAQHTITMADNRVNQMAQIIKGRLQACNVNRDILYGLKKELKDFNMQTFKWKK